MGVSERNPGSFLRQDDGNARFLYAQEWQIPQSKMSRFRYASLDMTETAETTEQDVSIPPSSWEASKDPLDKTEMLDSYIQEEW